MWYYLDLLDEFALPGAHNVNSAVLEACPEIGERLKARGDEFIGHGRTNSERQDVLWEEDERQLIAESTEILARVSGHRPEGWLGPYIAQSAVTLDLLKEAGYRYVMDWAMDDQPIWMRTRAGPILSVPYPLEVNNSPAMVFRRHTGRQFAEMVVDQFDEMLFQSKKYPLVFAVSAHPFIVGQPFRLHAFRDAVRHIMQHRDDLWITTPGEIARYCESSAQGDGARLRIGSRAQPFAWGSSMRTETAALAITAISPVSLSGTSSPPLTTLTTTSPCGNAALTAAASTFSGC